MSSDSSAAEFVKQNPKLTGIMCLFIGVIVSIVTVNQGKEYSALLDVPTTDATVKSIEKVSSKKGGTLAVSFEWKDAERRKHQDRVESRSSYLKTIEKGEKIQISVAPTDPDDALPRGMIDEAPLVNIGPLVAHNMVFLGFGFVVLGLGLIIFGKSS